MTKINSIFSVSKRTNQNLILDIHAHTIVFTFLKNIASLFMTTFFNKPSFEVRKIKIKLHFILSKQNFL